MTPERWQQITGMFHAALLRKPGQRGTFLQDACGADEALRAELEAMLAAHDNAGDPGSIPAVAVSEQMLRLQSGSAVGRYRIDALIGAGGMGQVYRARDPSIERDVAIKVLPADYAADAERLRRFEQEAHASGALNHPNVLTLYDVGTADGRPYLVMELLDGETLRDCVGRGAMPAARACEIAAAIARGLAAAHARGIVHRDLKPENVMVTRDGRVKILDFGIAKLRVRDPNLDQRTVTTPQRTAADTMLGTAGYMAPEQIRGEPTDERADLFALGAMLFELLTGRRAFDRESRVETLNAILHDDVPALGAAAATSRLRSTASCGGASKRIRTRGSNPRAIWRSRSTRLRNWRRRHRQPSRCQRLAGGFTGRPSPPPFSSPLASSPLRSGDSSLHLFSRHASWRASRCRRRPTCGSRAGR